MLARAPKLRVIANCAVGYDNVDIAAATRAGIAVTNTPDVLTEATADFTFALMLAAARRLPEGEALVRSGQWPGWRLDQLLGAADPRQTLGIVGLGRIGLAVARRAVGLGMQIVYSGPRRRDAVRRRRLAGRRAVRARPTSCQPALSADRRDPAPGQRRAARADEADRDPRQHGARRLRRRRCARRGAGGRPALRRRPRRVRAASPQIDPRLLACPRLVLAPHIGSATTETRTQMAQLCADGGDRGALRAAARATS